jgi:uncharacterized protein YjbI with pentapeptide repeats
MPDDEQAEDTNERDAAEAKPDRWKERWKPSPQDLKLILARHLGWLANPPDETLPEHDHYLEKVEPAYPEWREEALKNPEQARLSGAVLTRANLTQANLRGADLRGAELSRANLIKADLVGADLNAATLSSAELFDADLSDANLNRSTLTGAFLLHANLTGAHLAGHLTDLSNAYMTDANLSGAHLSEARLAEADLERANLSGAELRNTFLFRAKLNRANLAGADLTHADLSYANLSETNVTDAKLAGAYLWNAIYSPASEPPHPYVAGIRGLSTVQLPTLPGHEIGLVQLRKLFQDAGLRELEREATYRIERARTSLSPIGASATFREIVFDWTARTFRRIAFDWTTAYGLHPSRALFIIIAVWLLCIPVYWWSIVQDPGQSVHESFHGSGIYQVFPANWLYETKGDKPTIMTNPVVRRVQTEDWWEAVKEAAYFSLLSAVNIGFEQVTPGDWIRRLQQHEYEVQAAGWVRTAAGAQALLSVFLLAMWVLTQFGRPFQ